jgi:arginase
VSVARFSELAARYGDDLEILWIDSHPDIGTPASEYPGYHTMAVAVLTGHGDPEVLSVLPAIVKPERVALVGVALLDRRRLPQQHKVGNPLLQAWMISASPVSRCWAGWPPQGCTRVAIYFDVDTIDS